MTTSKTYRIAERSISSVHAAVKDIIDRGYYIFLILFILGDGFIMYSSFSNISAEANALTFIGSIVITAIMVCSAAFEGISIRKVVDLLTILFDQEGTHSKQTGKLKLEIIIHSFFSLLILAAFIYFYDLMASLRVLQANELAGIDYSGINSFDSAITEVSEKTLYYARIIAYSMLFIFLLTVYMGYEYNSTERKKSRKTQKIAHAKRLLAYQNNCLGDTKEFYTYHLDKENRLFEIDKGRIINNRELAKINVRNTIAREKKFDQDAVSIALCPDDPKEDV